MILRVATCRARLHSALAGLCVVVALMPRLARTALPTYDAMIECVAPAARIVVGGGSFGDNSTVDCQLEIVGGEHYGSCSH